METSYLTMMKEVERNFMLVNTKFGTLYIAKGGFGYQLLDSKGIVICEYDNDMPIRWRKDLKTCETEQEFFDTLSELIGDEIGIYFGTNKKRLAEEIYQEIKEYEELNNRDIKERTTKKNVLEVLTECANHIGKYYVLCDYWNYF